MRTRALRRAVARYKATLTKFSATAALFAGATLVVAGTSAHPSRMVVRPAALALVTPVSVAPRPNSALGYLSQVAAARTPATPSPSPAPAWQLANIANPRVDKWVGRFTSSLKSGFTAALARGRAYSDMISRKLAARGMPQELFYLAMIESEFKPAVRSSASAVGLWQFMASTARRFGLNVGGRSDERTNPSKATDAALTYLAQLHDQFGSWYLAAAAYNAGPGTVSRALRRVTGRSSGEDADFYRIASALPAETRDYVPKLVAAARVGKAFGDF